MINSDRLYSRNDTVSGKAYIDRCISEMSNEENRFVRYTGIETKDCNILWDKRPAFFPEDKIIFEKKNFWAWLSDFFSGGGFIFLDIRLQTLFSVDTSDCDCFIALNDVSQKGYFCSRTSTNVGGVYTIYDVTSFVFLFHQLMEGINRDRLTGLLNRDAFLAQCDKILCSGFGFMILADLDNLKKTNDNWGHQQGDEYIMEMVGFLKDAGSVFPENRLAISRISGDEFAVCAGGFDCAESRDAAFDRFKLCDEVERNKFSRPPLSFSSGIAKYPEDSTIPNDLLLFSDFAMSLSKDFNKGGAHLFSALEHEAHLNLGRSAKKIDKIIDERLISFVYVPYIDAQTGNVAVFEMFPVSSVEGLEDIDKIKVAAKFCHRLYDLDKVIYQKIQEEFKTLSHLDFKNVVTVGYMPQDIFYQGELQNLLQESGFSSDRICLCFDSEMRNHYDRMRAIDSATHLVMRFGFKNYSSGTVGDALSFLPHIVKLSKDLTRACTIDPKKAETVRELVSTAQKAGFNIAAGYIVNQDDLAFFKGLNLTLLGGDIIYQPVNATQIEEYAAKPSFWS